jgi:hypothetical protein
MYCILKSVVDVTKKVILDIKKIGQEKVECGERQNQVF